MAGWYVFLDGAVAGPFAPEELVAQSGVYPSTKVCAEGSEEWEALADIEPLIAAYQAKTAAPAAAKPAAGGLMACHFHPQVPGSVLCSYCHKNLCEECAAKDGDNVICRECIAKRTTLLEQQEAERQAQEAKRKAAAEAELAAKKAGKKVRLAIIIGGVIVLLAILGAVAKCGYNAYQLTQQQQASPTDLVR